MKEIFKTMPDSILPYLTENNKLDMIDFHESDMKSEISNKLGGTTVLDTLTENYMALRLSQSVRLEIKKLYRNKNKTDKFDICVVRTFYDSESRPMESTLKIYTPAWQIKKDNHTSFLNNIDAYIANSDSIQHIMRTAETSLSQLAFGFVYKLFPDEDFIETSITQHDILDKDCSDKLTRHFKKRLILWDGKRFKYI